uniref:Uncharacterized protein n=1 Tax=Steinernema glaseri TaxID=37863 RepID=A0A1I8AT68_9BILA
MRRQEKNGRDLVMFNSRRARTAPPPGPYCGFAYGFGQVGRPVVVNSSSSGATQTHFAADERLLARETQSSATDIGTWNSSAKNRNCAAGAVPIRGDSVERGRADASR